jgi:hypothetical protein
MYPTQESTECIIESQAFSPSCDLAPPSPVTYVRPATQRKTEKEKQFADGRVRREWGRSQIIRRRESLLLYKLVDTL